MIVFQVQPRAGLQQLGSVARKHEQETLEGLQWGTRTLEEMQAIMHKGIHHEIVQDPEMLLEDGMGSIEPDQD